MVETIGADQTVLADRGYDSDDLRDLLTRRGATINIRLLPNRKRLSAFNAELYKKRKHVERFLCNIKNFHAVVPRFDKRDDNFLAQDMVANICVRDLVC